MDKAKKHRLLDIVYIAMMIVPFLCGMVLKVLTSPLSEGISVTGSQIYFTIPLPLQALEITESQVVSLIVIVATLGLCLFMTNGITVMPGSKRQLLAEWVVEKVEGLVKENMGTYFAGFSSFVAAILCLSAFSSLSSLLGLHPPTSDINIVAGWAILVFILITYFKMKGGIGNYLKSFADPIPFFAPFNVISEIATPISMSFRHYGNVLSGVVISTMIAVALQGLSKLVLGWIPVVGGLSLLRIGLPAVLSLYFDLFSGCLQAYIFAMLTMLYVSNGFPMEAWEKRMAKRKARKNKQVA